MTIRFSEKIRNWPEERVELLLDEANELFLDQEEENFILPMSFNTVGILSGDKLLIKSARD